tara:strand:+ start:327 stop:512 length:186 start_codon:yes stop_codon:yes gene_type:complete
MSEVAEKAHQDEAISSNQGDLVVVVLSCLEYEQSNQLDAPTLVAVADQQDFLLEDKVLFVD